MRLLQGRGSDCDSFRHRIIFPRMAERLAGASLEQYLQHFHEHRTAVFVANIQAAEFAEAIAAADSQFEPPVAHQVNPERSLQRAERADRAVRRPPLSRSGCAW